MKRFALAIALACALSSSVLAGDVHSTGAPTPGEVPSTGSQAPGDMPTIGSTAPGEIPTCGLSALLTILDLAF